MKVQLRSQKMSKETPEEFLGIIQGLTDAMKLTHEQQQATNTQVQQLFSTIKDMNTNSKTFSTPSGLRLPAISLPKYSGSPQDNLERFLEHFDIILTTSSIPARYHVPYLKEQVQDKRSLDPLNLESPKNNRYANFYLNTTQCNKAKLKK